MKSLFSDYFQSFQNIPLSKVLFEINLRVASCPLNNIFNINIAFFFCHESIKMTKYNMEFVFFVVDNNVSSTEQKQGTTLEICR